MRKETTMGANADTVKSGWEAFAKGDLDAATATTSESAEIVVPESLPWGGTYTGPEGFKEMIGKLVSNFDEVKPEPQEFLEADGGHVIVTVKGAGTTKSGNELTGDSIWLYKVDDGKIEHAEFYGDTATAVKALS
jgi:ketosteroid isomerase-like protein